MNKESYLVSKNGLWMFNWRVPKDCLSAFGGKKTITKTLQTHNLREARGRRDVMLVECMKVVREVRSEADGGKSLFRVNLLNMAHVERDQLESAWLDVEDKTPETETEIAYKEALKVSYLGHNSELAKCTLKDALKAYVEEKTGHVTAKTISHAKRAVTVFIEYLKIDDVVVEGISRKTVKQFIKDSPSAGKTTSNRINLLSSIFKVALDDGLIDEDKRNPFEAHRVSRKDTQSYERFTDTQLADIFEATKDFECSRIDFHKFMLPRLAYVTGCRVEELASLQREQVKTKGGITYLAISDGGDTYQGKTINSARQIPVHGSLVEPLLKWKNSETHKLLFPVLESRRADGKLGDKYSKQFGTLKRSLGISRRSQGFHSFRVHMATNLERAGVPEERAVWILGHSRTLSLTYGLYSDGPSLEQLKDDVEKSVVWR